MMNLFFDVKKISNRITSLVIALLIYNSANAGIEPLSTRRVTPELTPNSLLKVEDNKYGFITGNLTGWESSFYDKKVTGHVIFSIDQGSTKFQPVDYTATVDFLLTYKTWDGNNHVFVNHTESRQLQVEYKAKESHKDKMVYEFSGGYAVSVQVTGLSAKDKDLAPVNLSLTNLSLETEIETERYYAFDPLFIPTVVAHKSNISDRGELEIFWDVIPGAETYDMEWMYINNYDGNGQLIPAADLKVDELAFQFNSTRISTSNTFYDIPYLYGKGYILYRVRGVGKINKGSDPYTTWKEGSWSSKGNPFTTVAEFTKKFPNTSANEDFTAHSDDQLNWQFSASYAEDGKSKAVISYFDGSLRNRQSVTKSKTTDEIIVGESIYDYQGRPAIQVLPVPVESPKIDYQSRFNLNSDHQPYTKNDFDEDNGTTCIPATEGMASNSSGASNYYSVNNPNKDGQQAYLPDAQKYPFTQVEYTADNTGRVRSQSGVGETFKMGGDHTTNYAYSSPEQVELDRLFGSEVGDALHYKKNMVMDPNGQVSISYLDPQGRVVATCLAGAKPENVNPIDNFIPAPIKIDLLNKVYDTDFSGSKNELDLSTRSLTVNKQLTVESKQAYSFGYKVSGQKYQDLCPLLNQSVCYDCIYDLKISLTDECNNEYLPGVQAQKINLSYDVPSACNSAAPSFEKGITPVDSWKSNVNGVTQELDPKKTYNLTKTLTLNQTALDAYTADYLKSDCVKKFDYFLDKEKEKIDLASCDITCQECADKLGLYTQYNKAENPNCSPCMTHDEWQELYDQCFETCASKSETCEGALESMLSDVSLLGQYGQIMPGGGAIDGKVQDIDPSLINPEAYPLSVFNETNLLPRKSIIKLQYDATNDKKNTGEWAPNWRFPFDPTRIDGKKFTYLNEDASIALVTVKKLANNTYSPEILDESFIEDPTSAVKQVRPQFLKNIADFIDVWRPEWAHALVRYHPEYDYYTYCTSISASHDFDELFTDFDHVADFPAEWNSTSWSESNGRKAYMDPVKSGIDPYFTSANPNFSGDERAAMINAMTNYANGKSIWQFAYVTANCPNALSAMGCGMCSFNPNANFDDAAYAIFNSLYFGLKQKFQQQSATKYAITHGCYNGCIGSADFNPFLNRFFQSLQPGNNGVWSNAPFSFAYFRSQFFNFEQPCNWARNELYKEKQIRFPGISDLLNVSSINTDLCYSPDFPLDPNLPDETYEVVDCPDKSKEISKENENIAALSLYQQCGQCPNAHNLEVFLNALTKAHDSNNNIELIHSGDQSLSCYPSPGSYVEFTETLAKAFGFASLSNFVYKASLTETAPNVPLLTSTFTSGEESCQVQFKFTSNTTTTAPYLNIDPYPLELFTNTPTDAHPGIKNLYTFSDITNICCLKYIGNPAYFPLTTNRNFQMIATVKVKSGDPLYDPLSTTNPAAIKYRELIIEGVSGCFDVGGCSFDPICKTSKEAVQVQNLFNALAFSSPYISTSQPAIASMLTTSSVTLDAVPYISPIYQALRPQLNLSNGLDVNLQSDWKWKVQSATSLHLFATLESTVNSVVHSCSVSLTLPNSTFAFGDIVRFSNIRPDVNPSQVNGFKITAFVKRSGQATRYVDLTGTISCLSVGECSATLPTDMITGTTKTTLDGIGYTACEPSLAAKALQRELNKYYVPKARTFTCENNVLKFYSSIDTVCSGTNNEGSLYFPVGSEYANCAGTNGQLNYNNIVLFSGIKPDADFAFPNTTNRNFIIYATLSNGVKIRLKGKMDCMDAGTCSPVIPPGECIWAVDNKVANGDFENGDPELTDLTPDATLESINSYTRIKDAWAFKPGYYEGLDHTTGNGTGYFMAARLNGTGKNIWRQTGILVEKNTDYRFKAWISFLPIPQSFAPVTVVTRVKLSIDGHAVAEQAATFTGPTTANHWVEMEFTWNSGNSTSADLKITEDSGLGTDGITIIGLDDIAFQKCTKIQVQPDVMCDIISIPVPDVEVDPNPCKTQLLQIATNNAQDQYQQYIKGIRKQFQENYIKKCLNVYEEFFMKYEDSQHHFTLYYYDQAGNLVRTVPPAGVVKLTDADKLDQVRADRAAGSHTVFTKHTMATTYKYNSLNQLVAQAMPDQQNMDIWNPENLPLPSDQTVTNTAFSDATHGTAFTKDAQGFGHIFVTTNGKDWAEINNVNIMDLNDVVYTSTNRAYAVGKDGMVLRYDGTNWMVMTPPSNSELLRLTFSDDDHLRVYTRNGEIWQTTDGGVIWALVSSDLVTALGGEFINDLHFSGSTIVAVGHQGRICTSFNNGDSWIASPGVHAVDLSKVVSISDPNPNSSTHLRFAIGKDGRFLKSTDFGLNWKELESPWTKDLKNIYFDYTARGWVIDKDGIVSTTNGINTWDRIVVNGSTSMNFRNIFFNGHEGYAVTIEGKFSKFTDNPLKPWSDLTSGTVQNITNEFVNTLFCIAPFASSNVMYIGGDNGILYKRNTTDSWTKITHNISENIIDMHFRKDGAKIKGVILTDNGKMYYTDDEISGLGGAATSFGPAGAATGYVSIQFIDDLTGFALTKTGGLEKTADGGASWSAVTGISAPGHELSSIFMEANGTGVAVGKGGEIWNADATNGWTNASNKVKLPPLNGVAVVDANTAYVTGRDGTIAKTTNITSAGADWTQEVTGTSVNLNAIASSGAYGVAVGENGFATHIGAGAGSWTASTVSNTEALNRIIFTPGDASKVYAVGIDGGIMKSTDYGTGFSVMPIAGSASPKENLLGIASNGSSMLTVGQNGRILKFNPAISNLWSTMNTFIPPVLNDAQFIGSDGIAVGDHGSVLTTHDGGNSWTAQTSGTTEDLNALYVFPDKKNAWAVGTHGKVIVTGDGGTIWSALGGFGTVTLNDVQFADGVGIITADGGTAYVYNSPPVNNWTPYTNTAIGISNTNINAVYIVDKTTAYAVCSDGTILKVGNLKNGAATTWTKQTQAGGGNWVTTNLTDVFFRDYETGYVIGNNGTLLKTTNGGTTWGAENLNAPNTPPTTNYTDLSIINNNNLIISGNTGNVTHLEDMKDEFASLFWYDELGRIIASQNSKQYKKDPLTYSYTVYDELGRMKETGEIKAAASGANAGPIDKLYSNQKLDNAAFKLWVDNPNNLKTEVTINEYDFVKFADANYSFPQENLRKRVSATYLDNDDNNPGNGYDHATFYSYDIHGNVKSLLQDNPAMAKVSVLTVTQRYKRMDYDYDLVSGKVKQLNYQDGKADAFYHRYEYDADNRVTNVYTSKDKVIWDQDAKYFYYKDGPLSRTELGDEKVQGIDYAYTLQGWIKGVNSTNLTAANDIGQDGEVSNVDNVNKNVSRDAFSYGLNYYRSTSQNALPDYTSIGGTSSDQFFASVSNAAYTAPNLYNGNISSMATTIMTKLDASADPPVVSPQLTAYHYDQLNRINELTAYKDGILASNKWDNATSDDSYHSTMSYDANGNIKDMTTNGSHAGERRDELHYTYENTPDYEHKTNRLRFVIDAVPSTIPTDDIETQAVDNYDYDEMGNLKLDKSEKIKEIEWTVNGKIKKITRDDNSTLSDLEFTYDALGNRTSKIEKTKTSSGALKSKEDWIITFYVHDATGNAMATYKKKETNQNDVYLQEQDLFGSSRLGIQARDLNLTTPPVTTANIFERTVGNKQFELRNHLSNILSVVSDLKIPVSLSGSTIDYYKAKVESASDYYAFGAKMPGRGINGSYRYGFNGKENDRETVEAGQGTQDYGMRIYNSNLGRFLSIDPLTKSYPELTPYQFSSNNPIENVDLDGMEGVSYRIVKVDELTGNVIPIKRIIEVDVYMAVQVEGKANSYKLTESFRVQAVIRQKYSEGSYKDENGLPVEFKFNFISFDPGSVNADGLAEKQKNAKIATTSETNITCNPMETYRGVVMDKTAPSSDPTTSGNTTFARVKINPNRGHYPFGFAEVHELGHYFFETAGYNYLSPNELTNGGHNLTKRKPIGGFMQYLVVNKTETGEIDHIDGPWFDFTKNIADLIIKSVPRVEDTTEECK
jgi:RHS repeat-associated protein